MVRGDAPHQGPQLAFSARPLFPGRASRRLDCEDEWAEFLQRVYRIDTGSWLQRADRPPGLEPGPRAPGRAIVAARGAYIGPARTAWWGMDGPVPGVMWDDFEPDAALCAFMVRDGLARGARAFIADIEAPSPASTPRPTRRSRALASAARTRARTGHADPAGVGWCGPAVPRGNRMAAPDLRADQLVEHTTQAARRRGSLAVRCRPSERSHEGRGRRSH